MRIFWSASDAEIYCVSHMHITLHAFTAQTDAFNERESAKHGQNVFMSAGVFMPVIARAVARAQAPSSCEAPSPGTFMPHTKPTLGESMYVNPDTNLPSTRVSVEPCKNCTSGSNRMGT